MDLFLTAYANYNLFSVLNRSRSAERQRPYKIVPDHCVDPQDASPSDENARGRDPRPAAPTAVLSTTFPFLVESDDEEEAFSDSEEFKASLAMWETVPLNTYPGLSATRRPVRAESDGMEVIEISSDSESSYSHSSSEYSSSSSAGGKRKRGYSSSPRPRRRIILPASWRAETSRQDEESDWLMEGISNSGQESLEDSGQEGSEGYEGSEEYEEENRSQEDEEWPEEYDGMEENENWEDEDAGGADSEYVAQAETSLPRRRRAAVSQQSSDGGSAGEGDMRHWCLPCNKDFRTSGGLNRHKQSTKHAGAKFFCTKCERFYQRYDVLQKHIKLKHRRDRGKYR